MIPGRYPSPSPVKERVWMALFTSTGSGNYCTEFTGGGEEGVCLGNTRERSNLNKRTPFFRNERTACDERHQGKCHDTGSAVCAC